MTQYNNAPTRAICANSLTLNYMCGGECGKHLSISALRHFFAIYAAQDCFLLRFFIALWKGKIGEILKQVQEGKSVFPHFPHS